MVPRGSNVRRVEDLKGATICVEKGTTHVGNLEDAFRQRGLPYTPLVIETLPATVGAFFEGKCKAYSSDRSTLSALRTTAPGGPERYDILPELVSREPLAPVVRRGDEQWATIVRWVLNALVTAERRGLTAASIRRTITNPSDAAMQRFVAENKSVARALGLADDWYLRAVEAGGNYGEIFERNLGAGSPLKIERGQNRLWTEGGLLYAPPLR
jgi:general L-amino acid transport system substrate-binding protein